MSKNLWHHDVMTRPGRFWKNCTFTSFTISCGLHRYPTFQNRERVSIWKQTSGNSKYGNFMTYCQSIKHPSLLRLSLLNAILLLMNSKTVWDLVDVRVLRWRKFMLENAVENDICDTHSCLEKSARCASYVNGNGGMSVRTRPSPAVFSNQLVVDLTVPLRSSVLIV